MVYVPVTATTCAAALSNDGQRGRIGQLRGIIYTSLRIAKSQPITGMFGKSKLEYSLRDVVQKDKPSMKGNNFSVTLAAGAAPCQKTRAASLLRAGMGRVEASAEELAIGVTDDDCFDG